MAKMSDYANYSPQDVRRMIRDQLEIGRASCRERV